MNIVFLLIAIFGFILTTVLLLKKNVNKLPQQFLASFYFIFSIYNLQTYIITDGLLTQFKWFYFWPLLIYSVISVPVYFYFKTVMDDKFTWKWQYILLFIPFLLSVIDVAIVFSKPASYYNQIVEDAITFPKERFNAQYGLLSLNEHYSLRHLWQLIYLLSLLPLLRRFLDINPNDKLKVILNRWLLLFYTSLTLMAFITLFFGIERMLGINTLNVSNTSLYSLQIILFLVLLLISIAPLYFPSILYGFPKNQLLVSSSISNDKNSKIQMYGLDNQELNNSLTAIEQQEAFLKQGFNLKACAELLHVPPYHAAYFFYETKGISFTSYRNKIRVEKAKQLIDSGFLESNDLYTLISACGFNSKSDFERTFERLTTTSYNVYQLR
ncbi:AraC family transcriptional regulator [Maribacter sp. BPC-D8]|uniref:helix-turn-helix domain-containing protein n=1 Tax=Maribacter sp. BPC-D8 TaxID=3053613 RepID=UPI002B4814A7|nr:AraC family transcriptional regulator [Maribacter sp. BPC-D8]WRI30422.1 AraC family transcriptional regulator [Maribacter sp. BPC-D8]